MSDDKNLEAQQNDDAKPSQEDSSNDSISAQAGAADVLTQIKKLEDELSNTKRDYLYLMAELDNFKKNSFKERSELKKFGAESFVTELLTSIDLMDTALGAQGDIENLEAVRQGFDLTAKQIKQTLSRFGISEIEPGKIFDPRFFEAISTVETTEVEPGGIVDVMRKAYKMHDKLIRPGLVVVAKSPEKA